MSTHRVSARPRSTGPRARCCGDSTTKGRGRSFTLAMAPTTAATTNLRWVAKMAQSPVRTNRGCWRCSTSFALAPRSQFISSSAITTCWELEARPLALPRNRARNETLRAIRRLVRTIWKKWRSYHRRSFAETKMHCFKLLSQRVMARTFGRQITELKVWAAILNRFSQIGTPNTVRVV